MRVQNEYVKILINKTKKNIRVTTNSFMLKYFFHLIAKMLISSSKLEEYQEYKVFQRLQKDNRLVTKVPQIHLVLGITIQVTNGIQCGEHSTST